MDPVKQLHQRILACRLCEDAGLIDRAAPVVSGRLGDRMMLIGQAPGVVEVEIRRPFAGRAGRELFRWLRTIAIEEEEFRSRVYMTAITKCFPGKASSGSGDRRPSAREIALCNPFLEAQLRLIRPETILVVGGLAIEHFFPRTPLAELIGRLIEREGTVFIPLPHPSGASRWLNVPEHRALLGLALGHVRCEWDRLFVSDQALVCSHQSLVVGKPHLPV
jgi:uracil-DNA glycosylase